MNNFLIQEYLFIFGPTVILSLALAAVAVSYVILLMKLGRSEKDKVLLQSRIRDQASDLLKEAHEKKLRIIQEAVSKAGAIIRDTQMLGIDVKNQFATDIQDIRKKQVEFLQMRQEKVSRLYDEFEVDMQKSTHERYKTLSKNMEEIAMTSIKDYRELIENEKLSIHKEMDQKFEEEYKVAQKHIEDYKANKMKAIDKHVFDILEALTRDVLGKSLTLKDHEELVQKALVQMKTDMSSEI